jgi:hypothetical protein
LNAGGFDPGAMSPEQRFAMMEKVNRDRELAVAQQAGGMQAAVMPRQSGQFADYPMQQAYSASPPPAFNDAARRLAAMQGQW